MTNKLTTDQIVTNEFTTFCTRYYRLTTRLARREERLNDLLDDAPLYGGERCLCDIDDLISYYREAQAAKAEVDETNKQIRATERNILLIMRHFEIPPGTVLSGEIPYELEYEIWANEDDKLYIIKSKTLEPEPENPNIIVVKLSGWKDEEEDD